MKYIINFLLTMSVVLCSTSCTEEEVYPDGNVTDTQIPIHLTGHVLEIQSRIEGNSFIPNDRIGLFVLEQPNTLSQTRHADNVCYTYQSDESFTATEEIYYPIGNTTSNFIAYYPYKEQAVSEGNNLIEVSVFADQSSAQNYNLSDFLTAKLNNIAATQERLLLGFSHQMSLLNIKIVATKDFDIQSLRNGAEVTLGGLNTQAQFNLEDNSYSSLNNIEDITAYGEWNIITGEQSTTFTGKSIILPPQDISKGIITLITNNKQYSATLPSTLKLEKGKRSTITLTFDSSTGIGRINATISDWEDSTNNGSTELEWEEKSNSIAVNENLFRVSNVIDLKNEQQEIIGRLCKEYLRSENINAQAYVLYDKGNENTGKVLQVLGQKETIHGGSLSWSKDNLTYVPGNQNAITRIYLTQENTLSTQEVICEATLSYKPYQLIDKRGNETITYPIVKIGSKYWMAENLHATRYSDGSEITNNSNQLKSEEAGYYTHGNSIFYNKMCVTSGKMAPKGWRVSNIEDWNALSTYVNNESATLKNTNEWNKYEGINSPNNLTGFNGLPEGGYVNNTDNTEMIYWGKSNAILYWVMSNNQTTLHSEGRALKHSSNEISIAKYPNNNLYAYTIRCVKE